MYFRFLWSVNTREGSLIQWHHSSKATSTTRSSRCLSSCQQGWVAWEEGAEMEPLLGCTMVFRSSSGLQLADGHLYSWIPSVWQFGWCQSGDRCRNCALASDEPLVEVGKIHKMLVLLTTWDSTSGDSRNLFRVYPHAVLTNDEGVKLTEVVWISYYLG